MQKENINEKGDLATVYEVSYLLLPSLALEQVPARVETLTKMVESAGGELISSENPILRGPRLSDDKSCSDHPPQMRQGLFWLGQI